MKGVSKEKAKSPMFIHTLYLLDIQGWAIQPFIRIPLSVSVNVDHIPTLITQLFFTIQY